MRRLVFVVLLAIVAGLAALTPARAQVVAPTPGPPPTGPIFTPLGGVAIGSVAAAAIARSSAPS
jgi:hypothetical protein